MPQQYLVSIAVGPVQEFIASARKLRDLWYGSYLLSELSKVVARSLAEQGCTLIFPAVDSMADLTPGSDKNVANKILAVTGPGADPAEITATARGRFRDFWKSISDDAMNKAGKILSRGAIDEEMFDRQVGDFGEFFAAWVQYDPVDYTACRKRCEQYLAGRKNLREFTAPAWDGTGKPKSSLDGVRESVFTQTGGTSCLVKKGEHLDALGIVKRYGPLTSRYRPLFDNLAEVAVQPYLEGLLLAAASSDEISEILQSLPAVEALYPEPGDRPRDRSHPETGWPQGLPTELLLPAILNSELRDKQAATSLPAWKELESGLKKLWSKTAEPSPYCCLLVGDGDRMGAALDKLSDFISHQRFSQALDGFAQQVMSVVRSCKGQVVYSGGDDVMAYVPLHMALDCAQAVNDAFAHAMEAACSGTGIKAPTFSAGMVVVHYHKPLHNILKLARKAEQHAKHEGGRNCLTIIQSKRSGSDLMICGKWQGTGTGASLVERLKMFAELYGREKLSTRLGYQLRSLCAECGTSSLRWSGGDRPANFLTAEAVRIIGRKKGKAGEYLASEDALSILAGQACLRKVADELVVAQQISESMRLASTDCFRQNGR